MTEFALGPEVVIAPKGRLEADVPSRLCKQRLFRQFCDIQKRLPFLQETVETKPPLAPLYAEAKRQAGAYSTAKELIRQHLKASGLGAWVRRPIEQDLFELVE